MRLFDMRFVLFFLILLLLPTGRALAHPHEFVTLRTEVNFTDKGLVSGMRYHWRFDEFFTAYALDGQDANKNGEAEQEELDALLREILGNIQSINYFTSYDQNGTVPEQAVAKPVAARMVGRQLEISFDVPFKKPVAVGEKALRYAIYDDEFYIAMNYDPDDVQITMKNAPKGCAAAFQEADPQEDIIAFASSLDKSESGGSGLGLNFAEWVEVTCK